MRYLNGCMLLVLVLVFSGCDLYQNDGCDVCSFNAIVRGTVANFDSTGYGTSYIRVEVLHDGCNSDSTSSVGGGSAVKNSGDYQYVYHSLTGDAPSTCYKASLIRVGSSKPVVLDGPKEFDMPPLKVDDPYNSVRVDFTYPDSLKE